MSEENIRKARTAGKAMTELPEHFWDALFSAAIMPAWHVYKRAGHDWATDHSDEIARAAVRGVRERLAEWAAEEDEPTPIGLLVDYVEHDQWPFDN